MLKILGLIIQMFLTVLEVVFTVAQSLFAVIVVILANLGGCVMTIIGGIIFLMFLTILF